MKSNSLSEKLELWGFEEGKLIYKDMSLGSILKLSSKDISCSTDEELNAIHDLTNDFLNGLPAGLSLQFVQSISQGVGPLLNSHADSVNSSAQSLPMKLLKARIERLSQLDKEGQIPCQSLFLVVRKSFEKKPNPPKKKWFFNKAQEEVQDFSRAILEPELKTFGQVITDIRQGLETLGIESEMLSEPEVFDLLFDQFNPSYPLIGLNFNREDIRDDLILSDMVMSLNGFALGSTHHRVLSLKIMPDQTFASMSEKLRELPFDSKLFLTIECLDQDKETFSLETQRRIAYAMYSGKKGVSDLESAAKLKDIESLLSKRVTGEEKIFSVSLNIVLRNNDEAVLDEQVGKVLQTMRELSGAEGMVETLASGSIFLEFSLPNARCRERSRRMNTSVLSDFLPIFGDWSGHKDPRILLRNRRGGILGFDPFSPKLTNFNQVVSGGSGAGKSFLSNILITHLIKDDPRVFILDIGGSYKRMAENLGGQYIPLGNDSQISMNPFDLTDKSPEAVDQKIKFMTSLVEMMTKEDEASGIGKLERSEIEQSIKSILQEEENPQLHHLMDRLLESAEPSLKKMGKILGPWCGDSPFGKFVDRPTNLKLEQEIVCFDLKGLESLPDLQAVCLFLITDLVWREVQRDRVNPKFVIFDECWKILENDAGSRFLAEVFRTFRKYKASAIAISQTMDDFARSKIASAILPNSSVKWVLKQTGGNIPSLKEILLLNDRETKLVESVTSKKGYFSEAFLIAGDDKQVVVVESTPLEYWLATTDPQDLKALELTKSQNPEFTDLELLEFLAEIRPRGASVTN